MTVSPLGYVTTSLGVTLTCLGSMYASLAISPASGVGGIDLPLGLDGFRLLRVLLVWA